MHNMFKVGPQVGPHNRHSAQGDDGFAKPLLYFVVRVSNDLGAGLMK